MKKFIPAEFLISTPDLAHCPELGIKEFALLGRSNVGKSSFINGISNNSKLAKTSNKPGKTRLINLFNFSDKFILADLPGYGFANVKKEMKDRWQRDLEHYLKNRGTLVSTIQFIDARHEIQANDLQMRAWLEANQIPVITIATKIDAVSRGKISSITAKFKTQLNCEVFPFSAKDNYYNEAILRYLLKL